MSWYAGALAQRASRVLEVAMVFARCESALAVASAALCHGVKASRGVYVWEKRVVPGPALTHTIERALDF